VVRPELAVRLLSAIEIEAASSPTPAPTASGTPCKVTHTCKGAPKRTSLGKKTIIGIAGGAVIVVAGGIWYFVRRRSRR